MTLMQHVAQVSHVNFPNKFNFYSLISQIRLLPQWKMWWYLGVAVRSGWNLEDSSWHPLEDGTTEAEPHPLKIV